MLVKRMALNEKGRDFVVGDVHGDFARLQMLMDAVGFDRLKDRLIAVGDLIDRGPDSDACLAWLDRPFFHSVIGNHELMAISVHEGIEPPDLYREVGGRWFLGLPFEERADYVKAFTTLPVAIEVQTPAGLVGIVHAEVPSGMSWPDFVAAIEAAEGETIRSATWMRARIDSALKGIPARPVAGVHRVYAGHTPVRQPLGAANISWIDTGACFGGMLSMVDLSVEKIYSL